MMTLAELKHELKELEQQIKEAEQRLPAHSTKPPTMMLLLDLEDQRDALLARIASLSE
ncbi:histidine kinase [Thermodesulfobacteriota bacterium]